jgi:L-ascorbate metabolism protein UlaG (beta-lactamase superfamily)
MWFPPARLPRRWQAISPSSWGGHCLFVTWYGTAGFRIKTGGHVFLIDPYLTRNEKALPRLPIGPEAVIDGSEIYLSHGHFDHMADVPQIARQTGAT